MLGKRLVKMFNEALVQRGVQWLSPIRAHHYFQSHSLECASAGSVGSEIGAAEPTQGIWSQSGTSAMSTQAARGASSSSKTSRRFLSRRLSADRPSLQGLREVLLEGCNGKHENTRAFSQVKGQTLHASGQILRLVRKDLQCSQQAPK